MSAKLKVKIVSPEQVLYDGPALAVTIPSELGDMQVYYGHIPVLAKLAAGMVRVLKHGGETLEYRAEEGFCRVTQEEVSLLLS